MIDVWDIKKRKTNDFIDQLLINRGIVLDEKSKLTFFKPDYNRDLFDPFLMTGMDKAVERIVFANKNNQKIGIFADYDADGIPGAAILYRALEEIGLNVVVYIPNRESGYGLSEEGIDYLIKSKCDLIITVDLGIRSKKEALYCAKKKIDLIITDHHLPDADLPLALAVLNPKTPNNKYPYPDLCGCGVVYKLVCALSKSFPDIIDEKFLKWNLDLVAISTIADVVPLTGENRILAKYGMVVLNKTKNKGLTELILVSKISKNKVDAYAVGFQIGPRINAPGRMGHATKSFELLVTDDKSRAMELALWLDEKNKTRQLEMETVIGETVSEIEKKNLINQRIIIVSGKWIKGIIGPSASRIVELFHRPVIIFSEEKDKYTGSARSVEGVNIIEVLDSASNLIDKYGGHKGAAGLTVTRKKFEKFKDMIISYAKLHINDLVLRKKINIDMVVETNQITIENINKIAQFEPFGIGNPRPNFLLLKIKFSNLKEVGANNQHLSAYVIHEGKRFKSIIFNFEKLNIKIETKLSYDIVFSMILNEWQGRKDVNLNIAKVKINEEK